jgi:hypothetical protein
VSAIWCNSRADTLLVSTASGLVKFRYPVENGLCQAITFLLKELSFFFSRGYIILAGHPREARRSWHDQDAMTMDDGYALFNPKLEIYNIAVFMIMNFIEIFLTRRKNG